MKHSIKISNVSRSTFHEACTIAFNILRVDSPDTYSRRDAEQVIIGDKDTVTRVLEADSMVMGIYTYKESPNGYSLVLFGLNDTIKKTRTAYQLYKDMKSRLSDKPVLFSVYKGNRSMDMLIKNRAVKLGASPSRGGKTIDYYSLFFGDKKVWK